ncbi:EamA family transporter [Amycolatopsis pigmentata]|uniref:DMT family transporter n=1 Tax=Amycolatopsis pigmentata TaxID=450801 RepID=A0ABW5G5K4_9PSEU
MVTEAGSSVGLSSVRPGRGTSLITVASVCFGTSGVLGKSGMTAGLSPAQVTSARIGLAAVLLAITTAAIRPRLLRVRRAEWPLLLGFGLLGVAGVQLCYFIAVKRLPVGIAMLLEYTSPVLIALWARVVRAARLPRAMWAGIALAMAGLAMIAQIWQGLRLDALGLLAGLGAAVCSAAFFLLAEHGAAKRTPLSMVTWGMIVGAVAVGTAAPPWTLPGAVLTTPAALGPWHPPVWLVLLGLALFSTVVAYFLSTMSLRHLPASVASVLALLEPVVAAGTAWALLGEALTLVQAVGAGVLLTGALLVQLNAPSRAQCLL